MSRDKEIVVKCVCLQNYYRQVAFEYRGISRCISISHIKRFSEATLQWQSFANNKVHIVRSRAHNDNLKQLRRMHGMEQQPVVQQSNSIIMQCMLANLELCVHIMQFGSAQAGRHTKNATNRLSTFLPSISSPLQLMFCKNTTFYPLGYILGFHYSFPGQRSIGLSLRMTSKWIILCFLEWISHHIYIAT